MKAHPHDHHLPLLITAAADSHMYVRLAAIGTLESHNGTQADDALFRALDDPFRQAASEAAIVLMRRPALAPDRRRQVLKRLITDLHDDYVPGNAGIALKALSPQKSPDVDTALMGLLESPDRQARHLAAYLLNEHDAPPTTALVRVSIAALAKDGFSPIGPDTTIANASSSLRWLARQKEIDDLLIAALTASRDPQQRFCCALILALHRRSDQVVLIAPVLIPHLQDNYIERDAAFAMRGLFVLGPAVTPWLDRAAPRADAQARRLIAQILGNLRNPPADQAAARRGSTVKELFTYAEDPSWENAYEDLLWIDNEDHW